MILCVVAVAGSTGDGRAAPGAAGQRSNPWNSDIVAVTVKRVPDERPTNGNPPRVVLEVNEVIQGEAKKDRSLAVWTPTNGGHFDPESVHTQPELKKKYDEWAKRPMDPPAVGSKWIVFGSVVEHDGELTFRLDDRERYPYTREKHEQVAKVLRDARERLEADRKDFAAARATWRATVSDADVRKYVQEADFVGVGRVSVPSLGGEGDRLAFVEVREVLKGTPRYAEQSERGVYALSVPLARGVGDLISTTGGSYLTASEPHLVFLREHGAEIHPGSFGIRYARINAGDGVVIADEAALRAAREAARQPREERDRPLVVYHARIGTGFGGAYEAYPALYAMAAKTIDKALDGRVKLVRSTQYVQSDLATEARRMAKLLKGTNYFVLWTYEGDEKGQRVRFEVAKVTDESAEVVARGDWPMGSEEELRRHAAAALDDVLGRPAAEK